MNRRIPLLTLTGVLVLVAIVLAGTAVPSALANTAVFVNELHYDNTGADQGEGVEIAGPAGTDLSSWSVVFYNGNGGAPYATLSLSETIPDQQGGFGTLDFAQAGIQNGSPDGFALVDNNGVVIQFLSYEGTIVAVGGPADGMTSTDIGVSQPSDTPVGDSLQLTGTGTEYEDFAWASAMPQTFGSVNTNQSFSSADVCEGAVPIADVQGPGASSPLVGQEVIIHGLVTADFGDEIVVQENSSAARSAVLVYSSSNSAARGDEVCVTGIAAENYDMTQVGGGGNPSAAVDIISAGNPLPAPAGVSTGDIATGSATAEDWESVLVKVQYVTVANPDLGYGEWSVDDTSGAVRVDDKGSYTYTPVGGEALAFVQGPLFYTFGDFKIEPRDDDDIGLPSQCEGAIPISEVQGPGASSPLVGQEVIIHGLVTADFGDEIVVQENSSAARSAVLVYSSGNSAARGDEVCVTGIAAENYDMTQVGGGGNPSAAVDIISAGNPLPAPAGVSTGDIATGSATAEDWESVLVKVQYVTVANPDLGYGEWSVDDTSGAVRVDDKGSYTYSPTLSEALDFVQGPLFYTFGDYKMEPRDDDDIALEGAGGVQIIVNEIMQNPSAVSDTNGEWFEVFNAGSSSVDINGWTIKDADSDSHVINNGSALIVPAGGYLVLGRNANQTINGGVPVDYQYESFALANGDDEVILLDTNLVEINRVEYDGGPSFPDPNGASMALSDPALDNNVGENWCEASTPYGDGDSGTPGAENDCSALPPIGFCGDEATLISIVQGPGFASPIEGQAVIVEAVVVGDFQEGGELNGFFVQEEDADFDGDVNTSEGVFVYEGSYAAPDVNEGDLVRVVGTVVENFMHTEITANGVLLCEDAPGPYGPVGVTLPETVDGDLEKVEGMNVNVTNTMSVAQNYFLGRYGQLTLSSDLVNRLFQPTNQVLPNTQASVDLADYNNRHLLFLDDGVDVSTCGDNPVPVPYLGAAPPAVLRGGDHVSNLTGVLDYGQINSGTSCGNATTLGRDYRLQPTLAPVFSTENPRTAAPADVGGTVKAVSFNVLNFFNGDGQGGGFPTSRGADSFNEFVRQRIKIYEAMKAIDGDIIGLMEIENDGFDEFSAIAELAKVLNEGPCWDSPAECAALSYSDNGIGAGTYAYIDAGPGEVGTDAITVGFIYKPASVTPIGSPLVVDEEAFVDPNNTGSDRNRPAIAQTFGYSGGDSFTAIVNHLKSKGSSCGPGDDDPEQASCNVTRTLAAEYLIDTVVPAVQASSGDLDVMIMGDLNAYAMEDPIRALTDGGFTNLIKSFNGDFAYSYTFDGMVGYLDHSLTNDSLSALVTGVTEWHINTDEPAVIDYDEDFNPVGYYSPDAYRASDHDPVVVGICEATPPAVTVMVDPDSLWPPNHKYVDVTATVDVVDFDSNPTITLVSVTSNEPDNGLGDGDTPDDIVIVDDFNFQLRAERSGNGDGRIYTITYEVTDDCGNSTIATAEVTVPKDQGNGKGVSKDRDKKK